MRDVFQWHFDHFDNLGAVEPLRSLQPYAAGDEAVARIVEDGRVGRHAAEFANVCVVDNVARLLQHLADGGLARRFAVVDDPARHLEGGPAHTVPILTDHHHVSSRRDGDDVDPTRSLDHRKDVRLPGLRRYNDIFSTTEKTMVTTYCGCAMEPGLDHTLYVVYIK